MPPAVSAVTLSIRDVCHSLYSLEIMAFSQA